MMHGDQEPPIRWEVPEEGHRLVRPAGGTSLTVLHSPYGDAQADREAREGHVDGWTYFLERLRTCAPSPSAGGNAR